MRVGMVGLLLAGCAAAPVAGPASPARALFERRYASLNAAVASRDPQAISAHLTADFRSEHVSGKARTALETVLLVSTAPVDPARVSETAVLSARVDGDVATVQQRLQVRTRRTALDGVEHTLELAALSTDTWRLAGGVWLLQRTAADQLDFSVDGKVSARRERARRP